MLVSGSDDKLIGLKSKEMIHLKTFRIMQRIKYPQNVWIKTDEWKATAWRYVYRALRMKESL